MAEKKPRVAIKLKSRIEHYTSKKSGKEVKQEVFGGFVKIKGIDYLVKLNPKRRHKDGTEYDKGSFDDTFLWCEITEFGESSFKGL